ncbi:hypothetical protein [Tautonia sociabilis]|uniref:Uncharacterized protein n=1 Tax=Tautonia sociabilis TaxID=2080755 RepID=A0A432MQL5_9BACT|nr:hypothetical protein [Tautonia sociabilis]RUL89335.1 hypothetical protein TsocGM_02670 [Tautonia sociabilis]
MRPGNITAGASKLQHDLKALRAQWDRSREEWDDPVSRDFETKQLVPLEQAVAQALHGIDDLQQFLARMIREIGPSE